MWLTSYKLMCALLRIIYLFIHIYRIMNPLAKYKIIVFIFTTQLNNNVI